MRQTMIFLSLLATLSLCAFAAERVWVLTVDGEIGRGTVSYLRSGLAAAEDGGAELVVVRLATPGGYLDAASATRDLLLDSSIPTVAFVDREALSAGALIALACETIVFASGAVMGAATAFTFDASGEYVEAPEKTQSAVRTLFRATAEARGRDPTVAEAMVDASVAVPELVESEKLLTLTPSEAERWGYADGLAESLDELLADRGYASNEAVTYARRTVDRVVETLTSPALAAILLVVGLLGLIIEMMIPGFGIFGIVGTLCLGAFFWAHFLVGLAGWESIAFLLGGLLAVFCEIFVFTAADFGFAGIVGLVLVGLGFYTSMVGPFTGRDAGLRAIAIVSAGVVFSIIVAAILIGRLPKSRLRLGGVILSSAITGHAFDKKEGSKAPGGTVGRRGVAATDLRPVGAGTFGEERFDVICEQGHLPKGTPLVIVKDEGYRKVVRRDEGGGGT
jgi:membrane-bound serine protease (ClpP class)